MTLALALLATAALGAGCGRSGGGGATSAPSAAATAPDRCAQLAGLTGEVSDHGVARASGSVLTVEAGDFFFAPTCVTGVQQGTVSVTVRNSGRILHNISIPDQGIDFDIEPGKSMIVPVKVESASVPLLCKYHRTAGMVGALIRETPPK